VRFLLDRTTTIGTMIDGYLKGSKELSDHVVHLLFSANRWEAASKIEQLVQEEGAIVLVDRYIYSGIAFSAAKGMDFDWCKSPDVGLPLPDLVIYLDLDPKEAVSRGSYGEERYERLEFQQRVYEMYGRLADDGWVVIDAKQPMEAVTEQVIAAVDTLVSGCCRLPKLGKFV
jgi:dTMP kinase